jgi:hypothetical protein
MASFKGLCLGAPQPSSYGRPAQVVGLLLYINVVFDFFVIIKKAISWSLINLLLINNNNYNSNKKIKK